MNCIKYVGTLFELPALISGFNLMYLHGITIHIKTVNMFVGLIMITFNKHQILLQLHIVV